MKKIAFICPYFGTLPKHTQLWLNSCAANKEIDWYLFTDDHKEYNYPKNVIVSYTTLNDLKNRFQQYFDFPISLEGVYKLGDYKPLYGYLFEKELKGYDAWGHIDVSDEIYGDIRKFVTDDLLDRYDKLMIFGHMCIYKNTPEVNERFRQPSDIQRSYKSIFSSDKFYNFEEIAKGSITRIYIQNGWKIGRLDEYIADISGLSYAFKLGKWSEDCNHLQYFPRIPLIFSWEKGKVFGYSVEKGQLEKKEYLYVHFKRRKMDVRISEYTNRYLIVPYGFVEFPADLSTRTVKKFSKNKMFYKVYFVEKKKAMMVRFKQIKEKLSEN